MSFHKVFRLKDWPPAVRYAAFWDIGSLIIHTGDYLECPIAPMQLADHITLEANQSLITVHEPVHSLYETRPT